MKKAVIAITLFDMVFILILSIAGTVGGMFGDIAYYFAFIIPLLLAFLYVKKNRNEETRPEAMRLSVNGKSLIFTLPVIAPFIAVIA